MAWEYMEELDYRYKAVSQYIRDEDFVVELNSGNSRLRDYVKNHVCNDLYDKRADYQLTDEEFKTKIEKCDVLVCLGMGGYEITKEELESKTITKTIIELTNKFKPKLLILECVEQFVSIPYEIIEETGYKPIEVKATKGDDWLHDRKMYICKTPYTEDTKN
jgi:hypothetical protein